MSGNAVQLGRKPADATAADDPARLDVRVLGPVEIMVGGRPLRLGGRQVRLPLAVLAANAGRVVTVSALVAALWGPDPPGHAERTVRKYVSRLRQALLPAADAAAGLVVTHPAGYLLRLDPDVLDAARFEQLASRGRTALAAGELATAGQDLAAALALWRGEAYGEFGDVPALRAEAARLARLQLIAVEDGIDARLAAGAGDNLVGELAALTDSHPGHERLWAQLMIALYRAGRQADALEAFLRARVALAELAGVEPSPGLLEVHRQVLAQDQRLLGPATVANGAGPGAAADPAPAARGAARPAQLPADNIGFTGRSDELAMLDAAAAEAAEQRGAVVVVAVSGMAGVGKTALALHWAHRVASRFPDGQLYVNLRGYGPGGRQLDPADAVRGFLDALGVPTERIRSGLDAQAARYRSELAGRRMLIVLDNAETVDQVRPLLPGAAGCLVLVTSRSTLTGLVAEYAARAIRLGVLTSTEAGQLLAARLGTTRAVAEPDAIADITGRCGRLPLALALVAARAALQPQLPLGRLAAELSDRRGSFDPLASDDPRTDVRAVFSWSYATLTAGAARLFRLLGLHPGPDVSAAAAASLAGEPPAAANRLLAELGRASLIGEHVPGRYACHDLLAAYAAELAHDTDPDGERRAALGRLLDHYTHTSHTAARLVAPIRDPIDIPLTPPAPGTVVDEPAESAALAWFAAEHPVLLAAVRLAADTGFDGHAWQLAWTLNTFLHRTSRWPESASAWRAAAAAAGNLPPPAAAYAHRELAHAEAWLGRYDEAQDHFRRALELYRAAGNPVGQASTYQELCYLAGRQDRFADAVDCAEQALAMYRAAGHRRGQAHALNCAGWYHAHLGRHPLALTYCRQALTLLVDLDDHSGQAHTWDSLGYAHAHLAQHTEAIECYQQALALFRGVADRHHEAVVLTHIGDTHHATGDSTAARHAWQQALDILTDVDPLADRVRARLGSRAATTMPPPADCH